MALVKRPFGLLPYSFARYLRACKAAGVQPGLLVSCCSYDFDPDSPYYPDGIFRADAGTIEPYTATFEVSTMRPFKLGGGAVDLLSVAMVFQGFMVWQPAYNAQDSLRCLSALDTRVPVKPSALADAESWLALRHSGYAYDDRTRWTATFKPREWITICGRMRWNIGYRSGVLL